MTTQAYFAVSALLGFPVICSDFVESRTQADTSVQRRIYLCLRGRPAFPNVSFEEWRTQIFRCVDGLTTQRISFTFPYDQEYPTCFYGLANPPLIWSYYGSPAWIEPQRLAVVGSREPTSDTAQWMESEFLAFCQLQQWVIVSGAARGVDQLAHLGALKTKSKTIAVLPSGLNKIYPTEFKRWREAIIDQGGCVVSQFPIEMAMRKQNFHLRNRLIAALSPGLFVVEANRRSGSRMTADYALTLGRELSALPVNPVCGKGLGGMDLIYDGAQMIRDAEDLKLWCALLPKPPVQERGHSHSISQ